MILAKVALTSEKIYKHFQIDIYSSRKGNKDDFTRKLPKKWIRVIKRCLKYNNCYIKEEVMITAKDF